MKYYYLISSLPVISIEHKDINQLNFDEIFDCIQRNLSKEDLPVYQALLYQIDNRNLLNIIFQEYHDLDYKHLHLPSVIPINILEGYRRNMSYLPGYMIEFLQDYTGMFSKFSLSDIELKLRNNFREYVKKLNSTFLLQYYEWQYELEHIIAQINIRKFNYLNAPEYDTDYSGLTNLQVHTLDKTQLFSELQPYMDINNYVGMEKMIDNYYWKFTENGSTKFTINDVLSYVVRLLRLARWTNIPKEKDEIKDQFLELLEDLKNMERSPKMPVL